MPHAATIIPAAGSAIPGSGPNRSDPPSTVFPLHPPRSPPVFQAPGRELTDGSVRPLHPKVQPHLDRLAHHLLERGRVIGPDSRCPHPGQVARSGHRLVNSRVSFPPRTPPFEPRPASPSSTDPGHRRLRASFLTSRRNPSFFNRSRSASSRLLSAISTRGRPVPRSIPGSQGRAPMHRSAPRHPLPPGAHGAAPAVHPPTPLTNSKDHVGGHPAPGNCSRSPTISSSVIPRSRALSTESA